MRIIDLGPAEEIERAVSEYRKAMRGSVESITRKGEPEAEAEIQKLLAELARWLCAQSSRSWQGFRAGRSAPMLRCGSYPGGAAS